MERTSIVGIDPGLDGGIAILRPDAPPELHVMPTLKGANERRVVNPQALFQMLLDANPRLAVIETQRACHMLSKTFKGGALSSFGKGRWYGMLEGLLTAMEISFQSIEPKTWQRVYGISGKRGDTGQQAVVIGQRLYPGINFLRTAKCTTFHDGLADALLIAEYGRRVSHE